MFSAACIVLGLIQALLWANSRRDWAYALSAVMAFSAAFVAIQEMRLFSTPDPARYQQLLVWQNLAVAGVLIPMIWSVRAYVPAARTWAAVLITVLWVTGLVINFLLPGNLTFTEIHSIDQRTTAWGDVFYVPNGTVNNWKWLADVTGILIPLYMMDAFWRGDGSRKRKQAAVITGGVVFFIVFAGIQAIVVDMGLIEAPYMVSASFLSIIFALTWIFARDAVRARSLDLELTQAQQETEQMMRANLLGEVASALAHELNQPLAAILGNAQAAQKFLDRPDPELDEVHDILVDIVEDDKRARDIILNMRRILKGDDSRRTSIDLEAATREVLDLLRKDFDREAISVRLLPAGHIPAAQVGRVAFQQVMLNLLSNAKHATQESRTGKREIQIRFSENENGVDVSVRDFGNGIAEEVRSGLFDPFVTTKKDGLGMGLTICRRIVEGQGGHLTAENAEGGGARFTLWLPAGKT